MAVIDVSDSGELRIIANVATVSEAHCVTADDRGGVWICNPQGGKLLFMRDDLSLGNK